MKNSGHNPKKREAIIKIISWELLSVAVWQKLLNLITSLHNFIYVTANFKFLFTFVITQLSDQVIDWLHRFTVYFSERIALFRGCSSK